jgi:hypothetical protein
MIHYKDGGLINIILTDAEAGELLAEITDEVGESRLVHYPRMHQVYKLLWGQESERIRKQR